MVWFGLLELWTTVGGPIGDGHIVQWQKKYQIINETEDKALDDDDGRETGSIIWYFMGFT